MCIHNEEIGTIHQNRTIVILTSGIYVHNLLLQPFPAAPKQIIWCPDFKYVSLVCWKHLFINKWHWQWLFTNQVQSDIKGFLKIWPIIFKKRHCSINNILLITVMVFIIYNKVYFRIRKIMLNLAYWCEYNTDILIQFLSKGTVVHNTMV